MNRTFGVCAFGVNVSVDTGAVEVASSVAARDAWRDALVERPETAPDFRVELLADVPFVHAMSILSTDVTLTALEAGRGTLWMLHAAAVALDDGRTISFVGPSGRGKTTASCVLGIHFGYVSDETTAITPDGAVLPYRKPLSIIEAAGPAKVQRPPSELGLKSLPDAPLRLARIVLLDRQPDGPIEPVVEEVPLGDALAALVEQTSYLADLPRPLATIAAHVAATGGVARVRYREADTLPPVIDLLADVPVATPVKPPAEAPFPEVEVTSPRDGELRVRRVAPIDQLPLEDGRVALLHSSDGPGGATLRILDGIGPAIWAHADGASFAEITHAVVRKFGHPETGDVDAHVRSAIETLCEEGVLQHAR